MVIMMHFDRLARSGSTRFRRRPARDPDSRWPPRARNSSSGSGSAMVSGGMITRIACGITTAERRSHWRGRARWRPRSAPCSQPGCRRRRLLGDEGHVEGQAGAQRGDQGRSACRRGRLKRLCLGRSKVSGPAGKECQGRQTNDQRQRHPALRQDPVPSRPGDLGGRSAQSRSTPRSRCASAIELPVEILRRGSGAGSTRPRLLRKILPGMAALLRGSGSGFRAPHCTRTSNCSSSGVLRTTST